MTPRRQYALVAMAISLWPVAGCASYSGVVRPVSHMSVLSADLEDLSDYTIDTYLSADARAVFPTVVAVAKIGADRERPWSSPDGSKIAFLSGDEARGWSDLTKLRGRGGKKLVSQVQFISPMLLNGPPTLKSLRDAAALLHAPLLIVYMQSDNAEQGYNEASIAYWSIVGMFLVPGNTVAHFSVCQALLVDTRSGFILATAGGESVREENVFIGAVDIAKQRTRNRSRTEAVTRLHNDVRENVEALAKMPRLPAE